MKQVTLDGNGHQLLRHMKSEKLVRLSLSLAGIGLLPLGLFYGFMPNTRWSALFDISISSQSGHVIFGAMAGLYMCFGLFWIAGAVMHKIRIAALYSFTIFMFGLAGGRCVSLIIHGAPHWLLSASLLVELCAGVLGILMLRAMNSK